MDERGCYVFQRANQPPNKKRKIEDLRLDDSFESRKRVYQETWNKQQRAIDDITREANAETLRRIDHFISSSSSSSTTGRLPTGFLQTGPGTTSNDVVYTQIQETVNEKEKTAFALLNASHCQNIKALLKNLIQSITRPGQGAEEDDLTDARQPGGPKFLNYDLQILHDWYRSNDITRCVVTFPDSEALGTTILTDVLSLLHSWQDRIHFILIFGVASSVDLFSNRLPRNTLKLIRGKIFPAPKVVDVRDEVFEHTVSGREAPLRLGPTFCEILLQRQSEQFSGIESFIESLKYAYMNHFNGNIISVFALPQIEYQSVTRTQFEAVRNLPSFQRHAEKLLKRHEPALVKQLLDSDEALFTEVACQLQASKESIIWTLGATRVIQGLKRILGSKEVLSYPELYIKAISGSLKSSTYVRELLLQVKTASPEALSRMLDQILDTVMTMPATDIDVSPDDFGDLRSQLAELSRDTNDNETVSHRETENRRYSARVRTSTPKVNKSRNGLHLPRQSDPVFRLATKLHGLLVSYFGKALHGFQDLFAHEVLFYDLKAPHREAFMPRPRFAIERALSSPKDYLGCTCCANAANGICKSQPATAILYQLYLESGALINVYDLWSAFQAVVQDQFDDERMAMALFFRGLAEMRTMGFIKPSRRKLDHLAKSAWQGL